MSEFLKILFLGLIQGLTEFLPVSSSGHLVIFQDLLKTNFGNTTLFFDILLHIATLLAVIIYYRKRLYNILIEFFKIIENRKIDFDNKNQIYVIWIVIASIPTAIIGLIIEKYEEVFSSSIFAAICLIITGLILYITKFPKIKRFEKIDAKKSFFIGIIQGLAVLPGISRSGSTISTGIFLKINPVEATEFSFLISIPAIIGAFSLKFIKNFNEIIHSFHLSFLAGFLVAFLSGLWALKFLNILVKKNSFYKFSYYCFSVGILTLILKIFL